MSAAATGLSVRLTAHPMQRVGAFALSSLVHDGPVSTRKLVHPLELTDQDLRAANSHMTADLALTTELASSKEPNGFWLGASYLFWPNCPINTTNRKSLLGRPLLDRLHQWRDLPNEDPGVNARCVLCDYPACGFYGKVDVPLLESTAYRNTTIPGHEGMALCRGCLLSFYALPYGCAIGGGRATVFHSWDDHLLRAITAFQVKVTRKQAFTGSPSGQRPFYERQLMSLTRLRGYEETLTDGVELLVFTNSNKEQDLSTHCLEQPNAEWIRDLPPHQMAPLGRAHRKDKVPGRSMLARNLFDEPERIIPTVSSYLYEHVLGHGKISTHTPALAVACSSYATKVLQVSDAALGQIHHLAVRITHALNTEDDKELKNFLNAARKMTRLRSWLRRKSIHRTLHTQEPDPLITEEQWRLLFDDDNRVFLHRDLLLIGVLNHLHELDPAWRGRIPEDSSDEDDISYEDLDAETA